MNSPSAPRRAAIIGCGAVTQQMYADQLPLVRSLQVTMVSDLAPENAAKAAQAFACEAGSLEQALATADLIIVATPPGSHAALARTALEAGRDVCVEKPFTTSLREAQALVDLARERGRRLYVAQFRRFFPLPPLIREFVAGGLLGTVEQLELFEGARFNWEVVSDYISRDRFGGVLFDTGSHTLDLALYAAGLDTAELSVRVQSVQRDRPEPSHEIDARFELAGNGFTIGGRLFLSRVQSLANLIRIRGSRGTLEFGVGYKGVAWIRANGRRFPLSAPQTMESHLEAFCRQYHELATRPAESRLEAHQFLNQISILEAIHAHA